MAPDFFCHHDSPSNLAESWYPRQKCLKLDWGYVQVPKLTSTLTDTFLRDGLYWATPPALYYQAVWPIHGGNVRFALKTP